MIYPSRAALLLAAAGAVVALLVALIAPRVWYAGLAWTVVLLVVSAFDALKGCRPHQITASFIADRTAYIGRPTTLQVALGFPRGRAPAQIEIAVPVDPLAAPPEVPSIRVVPSNGQALAEIELVPIRRGTIAIDRLWVRWPGPLGLTWKQRIVPADVHVPVLPDIDVVRRRGAELFDRYALQGLMAQMDRGDGNEFDSLVEFQRGMDRRSIDWKQSARHLKLHAKEYRSEQNNQIVLAIDAGKSMADPVSGVPRVDRMVSAALLTAWVALKSGDRVALNAFDLRPSVASGFVAGTAAFHALQRLAAGIDYSSRETNHFLALTTLGSQLKRRSLIILFTEITDPTAAQFMIRAAARLARTHLLLVVVLRDDELDGVVGAMPEDADDVVRAVTAAALLRDRMVVLTQLRHLGAHVIESEFDKVTERLVATYVDLKRRNLL